MSDFMAKRHEAFATPENTVFGLVQQATQSVPTEREKIVEGYDNEVYRVRTEQDKNFIVRIHRFGEVKPSQEIWAMDQSRDAGTPVPEVFFCGAIELPSGEHEAMVLSELSGKPLSAIRDNLSSDELDEALRNAGLVLRRIHSVKAGGFYHRHADGTWDFPMGQRLNASVTEERAKERGLILPAGFSEEDFDFMLKMIEYNAKEFPCTQPVLNHGDYLPEHIFVNDDLTISGVIDFGMFQGAAPIHDFAYFNFEAPRLNLNALIEGYGDHEMFHDRFDLRLNLHKLPLQMGHLAHESKQGNQEAVDFIAKGLKSTVEMLRQLNGGT